MSSISVTTSAVVFLFDSTAEGVSDWYGGDFDPAFLRALSTIDPGGQTRSSILRGDALVDELATKITAVSEEGRRSSQTQSHDMEVYRTVIWDLADAISQQWITVDPETFPLILGKGGVHCISVPTLPTTFRDNIDRLLKKTHGYLGAIDVDLGNPIQQKLFIDYLIKDAVIIGGQVVMELSWEGYLESHFEGAATFQPHGQHLVAYGALDSLRPTIPFPTEPSLRGVISLERYNGKRKFSLQERVLSALAYRKREGKRHVPYAFSVKDDPSNPLEADLPEAKFVRYLLDENNKKGGAEKAKFFKEELGISSNDWRYLAAQFHDGLRGAEIVEIGVKSWEEGFGVSFNAVISIRGLNGRTINIDTNWIMEPGKQPRLSTAVPAKKRDVSEYRGGEPSVVSPSLSGNPRWKEIFRLASEAGRAAAAATVPTPMSVQGFGIEMEGLCGQAWVRVKDARRGFAKWVIANDLAYQHYQSGAQIFANVNSQSVDRAKAYATAFAVVLRHNGIGCEVESRLD